MTSTSGVLRALAPRQPVALTLILVVLSMNALAIGFRMRLRGRKKW